MKTLELMRLYFLIPYFQLPEIKREKSDISNAESGKVRQYKAEKITKILTFLLRMAVSSCMRLVLKASDSRAEVFSATVC